MIRYFILSIVLLFSYAANADINDCKLDLDGNIVCLSGIKENPPPLEKGYPMGYDDGGRNMYPEKPASEKYRDFNRREGNYDHPDSYRSNERIK